VIVRDGRLLVIERSQHVRAPGMFCFPGGAVEPGESEEAAIRRELREELAVEVRPLARLWESVTPWGVELVWWEAQLDSAAEPRPHEAEVASFHWLTTTELRAQPKLLESNHHFLDALARGDFSLAGLGPDPGRKT
jgi:8-oxo-dGTP pyrophosphatase MutT (NUDIX family)